MIELEPFEALALSLHNSPGVYAVLVGSGLSRAAGIPTGWEITLDLIRRLAAVKGVADVPDPNAWFKTECGKEPNYSDVVDALASTQSERQEILQTYIEPQNGEDRGPTKAHHALAKLVAAGNVRVIITTNFDRLIENALRDVGVEPTIIASEDALSGAKPLVHAKCSVIKLHGDYLDCRIKNTESELSEYPAGISALLDEVFDRFGLLVVGWSGEWDTALRAALLRTPSRRYPFYWAARGSIASLAADIISHRAGRSFQIEDADSFFGKLGDTLDVLRQATRPHPLSVSMAIELAKKYCRDDRYALEWTNLLAGEARKVKAFIVGSGYPLNDPNIDLNALFSTLVGMTETLRRVCMISGRWGTKEANRAVSRIICNLVLRGQPVGGYTDLIALREFPASMCFYWALSGALEREDMATVRAFMHAQIKDQTNERKPLVVVLPLSELGFRSWQSLEGLNRMRLPASEFVFRFFESEALDVALDRERADELFDELELLLSLEFVHLRRSEPWAPLGRYAWKRSLSEKLKSFDLPADHPILKVGLLGGEQNTAKESVDALRAFLNKNLGLLW